MTEQSLLNCIQSGNIMHALLIAGLDKTGRRLLARRAASLYCTGTERTEDLADSPNYYEIGPDDKGTIKIDSIREMNKQAAMQSFSGKKRVFLILESHKMNEAAQNALLKTLEESPENTLLILEGAEEALLPTIRSRCAIWRVGSVSSEKLAQTLVKDGEDPQTAMSAARKGDGIEDIARLYCSEEYLDFSGKIGVVMDSVLFTAARPFSEIRKILETDFFKLDNKKEKKKDKTAAVEDENEDNSGKKILAKKNAELVLDFLNMEIREALLIKESAGDLCRNASERSNKMASIFSERGLLSLSNTVQKACRERYYDSDPVKTMDLLVLAFKEAEREKE